MAFHVGAHSPLAQNGCFWPPLLQSKEQVVTFLIGLDKLDVLLKSLMNAFGKELVYKGNWKNYNQIVSGHESVANGLFLQFI